MTLMSVSLSSACVSQLRFIETGLDLLHSGHRSRKWKSIIRHGTPFVPDCNMGLEMQNNAAEFKLRAERRAGLVNLLRKIHPPQEVYLTGCRLGNR